MSAETEATEAGAPPPVAHGGRPTRTPGEWSRQAARLERLGAPDAAWFVRMESARSWAAWSATGGELPCGEVPALPWSAGAWTFLGRDLEEELGQWTALADLLNAVRMPLAALVARCGGAFADLEVTPPQLHALAAQARTDGAAILGDLLETAALRLTRDGGSPLRLAHRCVLADELLLRSYASSALAVLGAVTVPDLLRIYAPGVPPAVLSRIGGLLSGRTPLPHDPRQWHDLTCTLTTSIKKEPPR